MSIKRRGAAALGFAVASALVLAACGDDGGENGTGAEEGAGSEEGTGSEEGGGDAPAEVTVTYALEQEFTTYNNQTSEGNLSTNQTVLNGVVGGFWRYGPDGLAEPDEEYGTYEKVSDDPLTIEFNINPDAVWSDGNPIDCDDMLLKWAAQAGRYLHPTETGDDGEPVALFSADGTSGYEDWVKPDCEPGDKSLTVEYEKVYASWEVIDPSGVPAHVAYTEAGLTEEEFIQAVRDDDVDALLPVAEFYNTGWIMDPGQLLPEELIPSSGPYKITAWEAGQSITLEYNENYWGTPPKAKTIVHRILDQDQQAQALQNQEVDVMAPQPNPDLIAQLENMDGVNVEVTDGFIYEHLDFNLREGHYFQDRELREAFAKCVPRELLVENLIRPQNPEAQVLDARLTYSFQEDYDYQVEGSGADAYAEQDIDGARQILEDKDMVGTDVRIVYTGDNPRRQDQVALIRNHCNEAGWNVIDGGAEDPFGVEIPQGNFDIAMFAWIGSGYVSGTSSTFMTPESCTPEGTGNNSQCYSSEKVDQLYSELLAEPDLAAQRELVKQIEAELWKDLPTFPLFNHPYLAAWYDDVEGVVPNPSQQNITWNNEDWVRS